MLDSLRRTPVRPVPGGRLSRVSGPPSQDHWPDAARPSHSRPAPSPFWITGWRNRSRPMSSRGRTTFTLVRLEPDADPAAVRREICLRLPYNDVYSRAEWASDHAVTGSRAPAWG